MVVLPAALCASLALVPAPARAVESSEAAACLGHLQRQLERNLNREFAEFRAEAAADPREAKPRGKFTPRHPVDVDRILKIDGEARIAGKGGKPGKAAAKPAADEPQQWVAAEAWCGYRGGRLVASDVLKR